MNTSFAYRQATQIAKMRPKFRKGDKVDQLEVIEYLGQSTVHPRTAKILSREHHWYRCICSCGSFIVKTQQQLLDKRRRHACASCCAAVFVKPVQKPLESIQ